MKKRNFVCLSGLAVLAFFLFFGLSIQTASAATVTLTPVKDNTIYQGVDPLTGENFEDNSCGAGPNFFSGRTNDGFFRRALIQFDIAGSVPAGSTITRVTLTLNLSRTGDNQNAIMTLHPVLLLDPATQDWGEGADDCSTVRGGGQGINASPGAATWLYAAFQQLLWSAPGGSFGPVSASSSVPLSGDSIWASDAPGNAGMLTNVQNWYANPASNDGWIIVGDEARTSTTRRFDSREGRITPRLTVEFTNPDVRACCYTSGDCSLELTAADCTAGGGTSYLSNVNTCEPNPCPQPSGACCNFDESCSNNVNRLACETGGGVFQGEASQCSDSRVNCGLEPFVDLLPRPAVAQPVGARADGVPQYQITMTQERQQLHRDLPATDVWTYNGTYPGPTIEARLNQPIEVKYVNSLPGTSRRGGHLLQVDQCPHGPNYWQDTARTVVHLHGGHVPARFDGLPEYHIMPGEFDVYQYPNAQDPATLWYHDHALGITRLNVYAGLAAYYILRNPADPVEAQLPGGVYEVPAVIQDRAFFENGELFYPPLLTDAFFGEKILVNGKVWPYTNVDQGKYRVRFLNGSQARTYRLRLENRANPAQIIPFTIIGTDGGFVNAPITANTITMVPAERFDVIVDFAGFPAGTEIVLKNDDLSAQFPVPNVMKFIVTNLPGFTGAIPTNLRPTNPITPIPTNQAPTRRFILERVDKPCADGRILGEWLIKSVDAQGNVIGEQWDDIDTYPMLGTTEIWEFQNLSNMMHPIHVHLVQFQVLDRNGSALQRSPWEVNTFKDTVRVPPQGSVRIIMTFKDFLGKFPFHCHILDHEDHEMMRQYQTINNLANCNNNGICGAGEDCVSCPGDCGRVSGAYCGNKLCEIGDGENFDNCPKDCAGKAKGGGAFKCGLGAGYVDCSDTRCTTNGFFCRTEPRVPACCGDALCEGQEQVTTAGFCALDCAAPAVNCSAYTTRATCTADPSCRWNSKSNTCVNR